MTKIGKLLERKVKVREEKELMVYDGSVTIETFDKHGEELIEDSFTFVVVADNDEKAMKVAKADPKVKKELASSIEYYKNDKKTKVNIDIDSWSGKKLIDFNANVSKKLPAKEGVYFE